MADSSNGNNQMLETIQNIQAAVNAPSVIWQHGTGKAFQFIAQATAMAVQDATDNLRNVSTISTTAIGVAMAQLMSTGDAQTWGPIIQTAQSLVTACAADFQAIGQNAAAVLKSFPVAGPASAT